MKVLIFEPATEGHRLHFVSLIAEALTRCGIQHTLAIPAGAFQSPDGKSHFANIPQPESVLELKPEKPNQSQLTRWKRQFQSAVADARPDHVFVPTADGLAQSLGVSGLPKAIRRRECAMHGLMMRGTFAYEIDSVWRSARSQLTRYLLGRTPWHRLFFLDPLVVDYLKKKTQSPLAKSSRVMPEPIEEIHVRTQAAARAELKIPTGGRIISCAGRLDARKGIDRLIRAFAISPIRADDRLLLVGRHEPEVVKLLEGEFSTLVRTEKIISRNQFADTATFEAVFCASDVVAIPYPRHVGSSGILLRAAKCNRPILASDWGWIGWVTKTFGLGSAVDVMNLEAFSQAIAKSLDGANRHVPSEGATSLLRFHSVKNFQANWMNSLATCDQNLPEHEVVQWDSLEAIRNSPTRQR